MSSSEIYKAYENYINDGIIPTQSNNKLFSFIEFINDGWIIPKDIEYWDILSEQILPSIFSDKLYVNENEKIYFYENYDFIQNYDMDADEINIESDDYKLSFILGD